MMDPLTLPAGRDLDAIIAEGIMGWTDCDPAKRVEELETGELVGIGEGTAPGKWFPKFKARQLIPAYSTDIAAAWTVVEYWKAKHHEVCLEHEGCPTELWDFTIYKGGVFGPFRAAGETAPLAICRAALMATQPSPEWVTLNERTVEWNEEQSRHLRERLDSVKCPHCNGRGWESSRDEPTGRTCQVCDGRG